jgi:hypothetical protein
VYQVDGEVGRFRFMLHEAVAASGEVVLSSEAYFPTRRPREWHKTRGFREEALCLQATRRSYRDSAAQLNRARRQWQGGTPVNTLQDSAQKEGTAVLEFLGRQSAALLERQGFEEHGQPSAAWASKVADNTYTDLSSEQVEQALERLGEPMRRRGFSAAQIEQVKVQACCGVYEDPAHCTNVAIDDIDVKKQKGQRERPPVLQSEAGGAAARAAPPAGASGANRPKVANTVARLERATQRFTLTGIGVVQTLQFVLGFLLNNELLGARIHIFTDGYKGLQNAISAFFAWHPGVRLLLDWYHLVKKFKEDLSLGCRGRAIRNRHLQALLPLLWYGLVEEARRYLSEIALYELKDPSAIERLRTYLQRNASAIPCYALRSQLGLRNSSGPVESANNELTARRQKHNGMSWSEQGSRALTALSMVVSNRAHESWVREHRFPLEFVDKAA